MMDEPWEFESKRKKKGRPREFLEKHQDGASLKFQVSMETQRNQKKGELTVKHIL